MLVMHEAQTHTQSQTLRGIPRRRRKTQCTGEPGKTGELHNVNPGPGFAEIPP